VNERFEAVNARFEVVETVLRDMSEQMVMQSRGIKAAIEARRASRSASPRSRTAGLTEVGASPPRSR
jgi:hypothetical protein